MVHYADPLVVYQPCRVGMMLEYSTGELLTRAAFMHHDDQGHDAFLHHDYWGHDTLRHHAALKGVMPCDVAALTLTVACSV